MTTIDLIKAASALINDCEGLPPEEMTAAIAAWVDGAEDKAAALVAVVKRAEAEHGYLKAEASSLATAATRQAAIAEHCRALLLALVQRKRDLGEPPTIRGAGWTAGIHTATSVVVTEKDQIPQEFLRVKVTSEPDKAAIKEAIASGVEVPGAKLATSESAALRVSK